MKQSKKYFIIYKPFKVLSQFSDEGDNPGLGSIYQLPKDVYPVGRLDLDSEGLLILTNDKKLNNLLLNPKHEHERTYLVEVEGEPSPKTLDELSSGVSINVKGSYQTKPCQVKLVSSPKDIEERNPPVNYQKHPERSWLKIKLTEGKNRQVRKMTAKVRHPTLRLIRVAIEDLELLPMKSGDITQISEKALYKKLKISI